MGMRISALLRDILCLTPLAIILPAILAHARAGESIHGILYAAPLADLAALAVILSLTIPFYGRLKNMPGAKQTADTVIRPSRSGVIITITRERGSEGKQIGKLVAEKLGDPHHYELCLDASAGRETCAETIIRFARSHE